MAIINEIEKAREAIIRKHSPHEENAPTLRVDHLGLRYDSGVALDDLTFQVERGERMAVVGPNGAGKSTLFKIIAGVLRPTSGDVQVYGHEAGGHICIAYVQQRSQVDWTFPVDVEDVVMMGRIGKLGLFHQPKPEDWKLVRQALEVVNLADMGKRQISQLSGGQQQRMFIARALAQEAELMLLDEPFTGLDAKSQQDLLEIMDELKRRRVTVMVALHDLKVAAEHFDRVLLLNKQIVAIGPPEQVFREQNLVQAYEGRLRIVPVEAGSLVVSDTCCEEGDHGHD